MKCSHYCSHILLTISRLGYVLGFGDDSKRRDVRRLKSPYWYKTVDDISQMVDRLFFVYFQEGCLVNSLGVVVK
jgi:hypothetical protein